MRNLFQGKIHCVPDRNWTKFIPQIYRHSSCLVKHRWEHSPHWRETSKFLLNKHQQVQLLEVHLRHLLLFPTLTQYPVVSQAAAILSHLAPSARGGTSLPEDRALWPAYLSGGKLHPATSATTTPINGAFATEKSVREHAVISASDVKNFRPGVFSVGRSQPSGTISGTTSTPITLCSAKSITGISKSEGGEHAWNSHSPSVTSRLSCSPPTEDESDFEMEEASVLNRTFDCLEGKKLDAAGETSEWDGMEMEMEM